MTPTQIEERIAELEAEIKSLTTAFNTEKVKVQEVIQQTEQGWQQYGIKAQQDVQHREGAVLELRRILESIKPPEQT